MPDLLANSRNFAGAAIAHGYRFTAPNTNVDYTNSSILLELYAGDDTPTLSLSINNGLSRTVNTAVEQSGDLTISANQVDQLLGTNSQVILGYVWSIQPPGHELLRMAEGNGYSGTFKILKESAIATPGAATSGVAYLSLANARQRYGNLSEEEISDDLLLEFLLDAEAVIDDWLRWRPAPTNYTEVITSKRTGTVLLPHQPVINISAIELVPSQSFPTSTTLSPQEISACWSPGEEWFYTSWHECPIRVTWTAGYDPVPRAFGIAVWNLLKRTFELGSFGDFALLQTPAKHMTMLRLPGGLSKQYAQPSVRQLEGQQSILDQMLSPSLGRYKREFVV